MDSSFEVQTHGFPVFGSFMPDSMELYWKPLGGIGDSSFSDCKKRKFVQTPTTSKTKNSAALKTHCEAERRRRERINGHFTTLRNFLSCSDKMDKATLLAKVIAQVKELKKQAKEATKGLLVPTDSNEVIVEPYDENDIGHGSIAFKASICCHYKPELIPEVRQAINVLKLTITKAEMSTLEGRVKNVLIVTGCKEDFGEQERERLVKSIRGALCRVLEKMSASDEYLPTKMFENKRRRVSGVGFESSTSSLSL